MHAKLYERLVRVIALKNRSKTAMGGPGQRVVSLWQKPGGFTMIEILIIVVIISIAAVMAVPMISSASDMQVRSAVNAIAADLEYAKSMAISRSQNFSVVFDASTDSYGVENQDGDIISHPVKKGFDYVVNFGADSRLDKVDITSVSFEPGSNSRITFDYLGSPYSGAGSGNALNSGEINLQAGNATGVVRIEAVTGFISIEY